MNPFSYTTGVTDFLGNEGLMCVGQSLVFRLGAGGSTRGPWGLLKSLVSHHFGLWIEAQQPQNCTRERSREALGEPMAQAGRFCLEPVAL